MIDNQSDSGAWARFFRQRDGEGSPALQDHIAAHPAPDTGVGLASPSGSAPGVFPLVHDARLIAAEQHNHVR